MPHHLRGLLGLFLRWLVGLLPDFVGQLLQLGPAVDARLEVARMRRAGCNGVLVQPRDLLLALALLVVPLLAALEARVCFTLPLHGEVRVSHGRSFRISTGPHTHLCVIRVAMLGKVGEANINHVTLL